MEIVLKKFDWIKIIAFGLVIFLSIDVIYLTIQNRELQEQHGNKGDILKEGDEVKNFVGEALDGTKIDISFSDSTRQYLFFVLSTSCPFCNNTLPLWNKLSMDLNSTNCNVIGISIHNLGQTIKYVESAEVRFYVVSADSVFLTQFKIFSVPETILIKGDGTIKKIWRGELSKSNIEEIHKLIASTLS